MVCPMCGVDQNRIIDSRPTDGGKVDRRRHECACGVRWTSRATVETGTIKGPISGGFPAVSTTMDGSQTKKPPPTNGGQPPTNSGGGVGGGLPSDQAPLGLKSDPNPSSPGDPKRARARGWISYPAAFEAEWAKTAKTGSKDKACIFWGKNGKPTFGDSWKRWEGCSEWRRDWFNYPHVVTWLNDGRYKQDPFEAKTKPVAPIRKVETLEQRRDRERAEERAAREEADMFGAPVSR